MAEPLFVVIAGLLPSGGQCSSSYSIASIRSTPSTSTGVLHAVALRSVSPLALVPLAAAIFVGAQQLWCYDLVLLNT